MASVMKLILSRLGRIVAIQGHSLAHVQTVCGRDPAHAFSAVGEEIVPDILHETQDINLWRLRAPQRSGIGSARAHVKGGKPRVAQRQQNASAAGTVRGGHFRAENRLPGLKTLDGPLRKRRHVQRGATPPFLGGGRWRNVSRKICKICSWGGWAGRSGRRRSIVGCGSRDGSSRVRRGRERDRERERGRVRRCLEPATVTC